MDNDDKSNSRSIHLSTNEVVRMFQIQNGGPTEIQNGRQNTFLYTK